MTKRLKWPVDDEHALDRRDFLCQASQAGGIAASLLFGGPGAAPVSAAEAAQPIVETSAGKIRGAASDGVCVFKGIPYGASTAGQNRFMPPQKPEAWAGVRDALQLAGHAPQAPAAPRRPELADFSGPPDTIPVGEDCLTLHVWTPALDNARRPVMVWFHGGAFSYGSANGPRLDSANLARRGDVVVVTVNHRLNIFGHLYLAELGGERFARSGNAGVLDLIASLEWVRDNIARFGGDPGQVTIFGQSGGGGKVSVLLAMPAARGLFHRAIVMSGAGIRMVEPERATRLAEAVLKELGLGRDRVAELQTLPMERLQAAVVPAQRTLPPSPHPLLDRYNFGPVVDGRDLPAHPFDPKAPDLSDDIPVMVGGTKDENSIFMTTDDAVWNRTLSEAELRTRVARIAGDRTDQVLEIYARLYPEANPAERLIAITTDSGFTIRSILLAERKQAKERAPVYMYEFAWDTPILGGKLKSPHALDVPFVFETIDAVGATDKGPQAHALADRMSAAWVAFARNGKPEHSALPPWPAYTAQNRATMLFGNACEVRNDPLREQRLLWSGIAQA